MATVLELRLLLQDDDFTMANEWFCDVENVIVSLSQKELVARGAESLTYVRFLAKLSDEHFHC